MLASVVVLALKLAAALAILYTLAAAWLIGRWRTPAPPTMLDAPSVSILKALCGNEPHLAENLRTFVQQDYPRAIQIVCGVASSSDPAIAAASQIPGCELVIGRGTAGGNAKVANLATIAARTRHELLVASDSDIAVDRTYLARIAAAMAAPGVGAVTCLYAGRGDAGWWSRLCASGISYQFLPSVIVGLAIGRGEPCMGSTIALSRETLDAIGGFARFADVLADDHALGAAVRQLGLTVAVPPMIVTHGCSEDSLAALVRHELRWAATIRRLDPAGHAGSVVTHPLPLAALAAVLGGGPTALALCVAAAGARAALKLRVDAVVGRRTAPLWLLPFRDLLSFVVFLASFPVRSVKWRSSRLDLENDGRILAVAEASR